MCYKYLGPGLLELTFFAIPPLISQVLWKDHRCGPFLFCWAIKRKQNLIQTVSSRFVKFGRFLLAWEQFSNIKIQTMFQDRQIKIGLITLKTRRLHEYLIEMLDVLRGWGIGFTKYTALDFAYKKSGSLKEEGYFSSLDYSQGKFSFTSHYYIKCRLNYFRSLLLKLIM